MNKIKTVKIKNKDGSISEESYPISVNANLVDMSNGYDLQKTIGTIDVDKDGDIAAQLNKKINKSDIIDNLNSSDANKVLSAKQGKVLNEAVAAANLDIRKKPYYYSTVADMKADTKLKAGDMAITLGYYEENDGGSGLYKIVDDSQLVDDGGSIHDLSNGLKAELIIEDNTINIKQFGAKENDSTFDNSIILNSLFNNLKYTNYSYYIPGGIFYLLNSVIINRRCDGFILKGNGHLSDQGLETGTQLIYTGTEFAITFNQRLWRSQICNFDIMATNGSGLHFMQNLSGTSINEIQMKVTNIGIKCEKSGYSYWNNINIVDNKNSTDFIGFDFENNGEVIEYVYLNECTAACYFGNYENSISYGIKSNTLNHFYMQNCDFVNTSYGLYLDAIVNSKYIAIQTTNFSTNVSNIYLNSKQTSISGVFITECSFSIRKSGGHILEITRETNHYLRGLVFENNHVADDLISGSITTDYLITVTNGSMEFKSCIINNNGYNANANTNFINLPAGYNGANFPLFHTFIKPRFIGLEGNGTSTSYKVVLDNKSPFTSNPGVIISDTMNIIDHYLISNTKDGELSITIYFNSAYTGRNYISIHVLSDCITEMKSI